MRHIYHFFSLREKKLDILQLHQLLVVPEQKLDLIQHYKLQVLTFHFHCYPTWDQLKLTTSPLPFELQNQFKLLIILSKIKAFLERVQKLYTKNATSQGLVFIQRRYGCRTR